MPRHLRQFEISNIVGAARLAVLALLASLVLWTDAAQAIDVQPSPRVRSAVVVRAAPTSNSEPLARLRPGEALTLIDEVPGWYRVRLDDGSSGYVSKGWTIVIEDAAEVVDRYRVHFVDVGTGLATFVEGPDFSLIYDGGSNDDLKRGAQNRLLAYLRRVRPDLRTIDHLILSHPHRDHVELLPDLFDTYQVTHVWDSGRTHDICGYRGFLQKVQAEPGVTYHDAHGSAGTHVVSLPTKTCYGQPASLNVNIPHGRAITAPLAVPLGAGAQMTFLHADAAHHPDPNDNSVVVRLDLGTSRLLFTGDAEAAPTREPPSVPPRPMSIEGKLVACCAAELRSDVLVAGHHGSMTSSRIPFLDAVGARIFVVSSGPHKYSSVTLPDAVVEQELERRGPVWRTYETDETCRTAAAKIGPDNDNEAGGCDNVLVRLSGTGAIVVNYERIAD